MTMTTSLIAGFCCMVAQHWVLSVTPPASPPTIDLEDRRVLAAGNPTALLGEITITETTAPNPAREEDSVIDLVSVHRGRSEVNVSVSGPLRAGDAVFLDLDANGAQDPGEELKINPSSGEASASFFSDALMPSSWAIRYLPNGKDLMKRGEFVISATVDYGESSHADPDALSWRTPLQYDGASSFAVISPPTYRRLGPDDWDNQFRVTCDSGGPSCVVFLECRDRGRNADHYLAELHAIGDKQTVRMSQDDLADIFGGRDWTEYLSCHVLSSDPVEVQVLTRAKRIQTIFDTPQSPPWWPRQE